MNQHVRLQRNSGKMIALLWTASRVACLGWLLAGLVGCASSHDLSCGISPAANRTYSDDAWPRSQTNKSPNAVAGGVEEQPRLIAAKLGFQPVNYETTQPHGQNGQVGPKAAIEPGDSVETLPVPGSIPTGQGWSLDETIKQVLLADPKLRAGMENIAQSQGDLLQSSLLPNPTFMWDYVLLPLNGPFSINGLAGPPQQDAWIGYPLDWLVFGKRAAALVSARQDVQTSEFDFADLVRTRVTAASLAYYDLLEAKALLAEAQKDAKNLAEVTKAVATAVKSGQRADIELKRIQLDLLKSQQVVRDATSLVNVSRAKLRSYLGTNAPTGAVDIEGNLSAPVLDVPLSVEEAYNQAVQDRPDIQSLESKVAKAEADVRVENRNAFPDLTAKFGYTRQLQGDVGLPNRDSWNVEIDMGLPVFNRNQGKRLKAKSVVAQSTYTLHAGLVDLRAEVEQAVSELHTSYLNAQAVGKEQLILAEQVRNSIQKAYLAGTKAWIEFLDAERNYRETHRLYINTRANYWRAIQRFNSALGKQVLK
jgi:cobalt-zinc-cadmium efflux system outer membrane protein